MRAVVFANGEIPDIQLAKRLITEEDYLVSADGGLRYMRQLKITPNLIIGDLDSVSSDDVEYLDKNSIETMKFPTEKDQTDLEIACMDLVNRGYTDILVIGALGGRIDQTLANIGLISLFSNDTVRIEFDDGREQIMLIRKQQKIFGEKGDTVSLIPLCSPAEGVITTGLRYSLCNEQLFPEQTRGISNVMTGKTAEVHLTSGLILCIHIRRKIEKVRSINV